MTAIVEAESTLTDRYQTTVPEPVRQALKLGKRDRIRYSVLAGGEVVLTRAAANDDPALRNFLVFLADDIARHPERLRTIDTGLVKRAQTLVGNIDVDLDAPLPADNE